MASPFYAAWALREAVHNADTAYLETHVDWDGVRASLKESIARSAKLLPEISEAGEAVQPTMWQRIKGLLGATVVDRFVESYITPEGLPKLYAYKMAIKGPSSATSLAANGTAKPKPASFERFEEFWSRIKRAEFQSFTRVEFELADHASPDRHYVTRLELDGLTWMLTSVKIIDARATADAAVPSLASSGS